MKISFIGAGSMAEAIIAGIIEKEVCRQEDIYATNRENETKMAELETKYGIHTTYNQKELLQDADIIVFAVKPKDADTVLEKIKPYIEEHSFFISVMAGVSISFLEERLKANCAIARAMPNTSASIGRSATAITFNEHVSGEQQQLALNMFSAVGITEIVDENQLDAITAISGSGPAYVYYIVEAMEQSAREIGLEADMAKRLIIQTIAGAAEMLSTSNKGADELRIAVTSPGGTTEAGIGVLQQRKVNDAFIECIKAAAEQPKKLGHIIEAGQTTPN